MQMQAGRQAEGAGACLCMRMGDTRILRGGQAGGQGGCWRQDSAFPAAGRWQHPRRHPSCHCPPLQLPIAMLACARIGAVHSVVFGGFSSDALASRLEDCKSRVLITCNGEQAGGGW